MVSRAIVDHSYEKCLQVEEALSLIREHAKKNGFIAEIRSTDSRPATSTCRIFDKSGVTAVGHGKGLGLQSEASAIFEAFEHYYFHSEDKKALSTRTIFDTSENGPFGTHGSPDLLRIFGGEQVRLECAEYVDLNDPSKSAHFPLALSDPNYSAADAEEKAVILKSGLMRYATNSGTAIGVNRVEAQLHGVLELIERDAIGICFARHIFKRNPDPVRRVKIESLPCQIKKIAMDAMMLTNSNITIWDITTDLGVPCILCSLRGELGQNFQIFGSGASLNKSYALQRAILEALQGVHLQFEFGSNLQSDLKPQVKLTRHQMCDLDGGYFGYLGGVIDVDYDQIPHPANVSSQPSVEAQLNMLVNKLRCLGHRVYCRFLINGSVCVAQSIAPTLERFYLLQHGVLVGPGGRAREARNCS